MELSVDNLHFPTPDSVNLIDIKSTLDYEATFKVRLTHIDVFQARPSKGTIPPRGVVTVEVASKGDPESVAAANPRVLFSLGEEGQEGYCKAKLSIIMGPPVSGTKYKFMSGGQLVTSVRSAPSGPPPSRPPPAMPQSPSMSPSDDGSSNNTVTINVSISQLSCAAPKLDPSISYYVQATRGDNAGTSQAVYPDSEYMAQWNGGNGDIMLTDCIIAEPGSTTRKQLLQFKLIQCDSSIVVGQVKINSSEYVPGQQSADVPVKGADGSELGTLSLTITMSKTSLTNPPQSPVVQGPNRTRTAVGDSTKPFIPTKFVPPTFSSPTSGGGGQFNPLDTDFVPAAPPKDQNIVVMVRVRPLPPSENCWKIDSRMTSLEDDESHSFEFDRVLGPDTTNQDVFNIAGDRFVESVLGGINGTLFMYGQTASGKTHTMFGEDDEPGLTPLIIFKIFDSIQQQSSPQRQFQVFISYFEIYNEEINDLLNLSKKNLPIRQNKDGSFSVGDLTVEPVQSPQVANRLLHDGANNKKMGFSVLNDRSSRSHTIFQIKVTCQQETQGKKKTMWSELNMVDLAGSETMSDKGDAAQKKETSHINLSLTYLKRVITELAKKEKFISYRNSVLTKILKQSLGGNAKTAIICCVHTGKAQKKDTKNTLTFGQMAKTIKNSIRVNAELADGNMREEIKKLMEQCQQLSAALDVYRSLEDDYRVLQEKYEELQKENLELRQNGGGGGSGPSTTPATPVGRPAPTGGPPGPPGRPPPPGTPAAKRPPPKMGGGGGGGDDLQQKVFQLENQLSALKVQHKKELLEAVDKGKKSGKDLGDDVLQELMTKDERVDRLTYQIISFLYFGTKITYVGTKGETTKKCLYLSSENGMMFVCLGNLDHDDKPLKTQCYEKIPVKDIKRVVLGQYSDAFRRMNAHANVSNPMHHPFFENSFEIIGRKKKSVDAWAETPSDFEAWIMALNQVTGIPAEWGDTMDLTPYSHVQLLDQEEMGFCSTNHIVPVDYILAKERILAQECQFLTLFDVRTVSCLDLYHSQKLFAFFVHRGWVAHRKLFFLDRNQIDKTVRFGVLDSAQGGAGGEGGDAGDAGGGDDMEF
eukprot:PhF_6_TR44239/c1_g1_i3/m.68027/K11498/CENPE; centromeric protein E